MIVTLLVIERKGFQERAQAYHFKTRYALAARFAVATVIGQYSVLALLRPITPKPIMRAEDLPYEHAGAGSRLAHPPGLHGIIVDGGDVLVNRIARKRFPAAEFFEFQRTVAVHNVGGDIHLFV